MKILVIGNSQAACLYSAFNSPHSSISLLKDADWIIAPSGQGPSIILENGCARASSLDQSLRLRMHPSDSVLKKQVYNYDLIIVSALGWFDGGHQWSTSITHGHTHLPSTFRLCNNREFNVISHRCFQEVIFARLSQMPGFRFLNQIKEIFKGKIIVQPFPLISSGILERHDWKLSSTYEDPVGTYHYFLDLKDRYLVKVCEPDNCFLLGYPDSSWRKSGFTPEQFIRDPTFLHPSVEYYRLVLNQLDEQVRALY